MKTLQCLYILKRAQNKALAQQTNIEKANTLLEKKNGNLCHLLVASGRKWNFDIKIQKKYIIVIASLDYVKTPKSSMTDFFCMDFARRKVCRLSIAMSFRDAFFFFKSIVFYNFSNVEFFHEFPHCVFETRKENCVHNVWRYQILANVTIVLKSYIFFWHSNGLKRLRMYRSNDLSMLY